jgi:hypothetical protein
MVLFELHSERLQNESEATAFNPRNAGRNLKAVASLPFSETLAKLMLDGYSHLKRQTSAQIEAAEVSFPEPDSRGDLHWQLLHFQS